MDKEFTLRLSLGTMVFVVLCILANIAANKALDVAAPTPSIAIPTVEIPKHDSFKAGDLPTSMVNIKARDEVKQQGAESLKPCMQPTGQVYSRPQFGSQPIGAVQLHPYSAPEKTQAPPRGPATADQRPVSKYQLALFIDSGRKSSEMLKWFDEHDGLSKLKSQCQFQVYTANTPMYRERFSAIIPTDVFPAVMFLRPNGGHIHIAGGQDVPDSADELYSDLSQGWQYAEELRKNSLQSREDDNSPLPDSMDDDSDRPKRPLLRPLLNRRDQEKDKSGWVLDAIWGGKQINAALIVLVVLVVAVLVAAAIRFRRD